MEVRQGKGLRLSVTTATWLPFLGSIIPPKGGIYHYLITWYPLGT
ncbi:hypothetical protein [Nostoc sp.]